MPALQAFALMHNSDISGVGIVDRVSGHLVANLSVSDLRCLRSSDDFDLLGLPVIRFAHARWASELRLSGGEEEAAQPPPPTPGLEGSAAMMQQGEGKPLRPAVVTVGLDASLLTVMETLVQQRLHRVYATENAKPVSVVTLTDVLRLFAVDPTDDPEGLLTW
jgi:CBS domain-containing protein